MRRTKNPKILAGILAASMLLSSVGGSVSVMAATPGEEAQTATDQIGDGVNQNTDHQNIQNDQNQDDQNQKEQNQDDQNQKEQNQEEQNQDDQNQKEQNQEEQNQDDQNQDDPDHMDQDLNPEQEVQDDPSDEGSHPLEKEADADMSGTCICDPGLLQDFDNFVNENSSNALSITPDKLISILKEMISTGSNYFHKKEAAESADAIIDLSNKMDVLIQKLEDLTKSITLAQYHKAITDRAEKLRAMHDASGPAYRTILKIIKEDKTDNWLEHNFKSVKALLADWERKVVMGDDITTAVVHFMQQYITNYQGPNEESLPVLYDKYAKMIYPWEHQGYAYREALRQADLLVMLESYFLYDLDYQIKSQTGEVDSLWDEHIKDLTDTTNKYLEVLNNNPVIHHDDQRICQIPGLEGYVFSSSVDHLDLTRPLIDAFKNTGFYVIPIDDTDEANTKSLIDNVFSNVTTFQDSSHTASQESHTGYRYVQQSVYKKMWAYYKEMNKKLPENEQYKNLSDALTRNAGFSGFDNAGNRYFVPEQNREFSAGWYNGYRELTYKSIRIKCRTWKNHDEVKLDGFLNENTDSKNLDFVGKANFKKAYHMTTEGNVHNEYDFVSLRMLQAPGEEI